MYVFPNCKAHVIDLGMFKLFYRFHNWQWHSTVRYNLDSISTLKSLQACLYVSFTYDIYFFQIFLT